MNALVIVVVNARQFDGKIVPTVLPVRAAKPWQTVIDAWSAAQDVRSDHLCAADNISWTRLYCACPVYRRE